MSDILEKTGYIYILASGVAGTLYLGVTSDPVKRISEHKEGITGGFSAKHDTHRLVYLETCGSMDAAIAREKKLKKWRRAWKIALIEEKNSKWADLYPALLRSEFGHSDVTYDPVAGFHQIKLGSA